MGRSSPARSSQTVFIWLDSSSPSSSVSRPRREDNHPADTGAVESTLEGIEKP
ncbi:hypothetical protein [Natronorubrum sp. A-ect3]|uniref:hypothetical protein n=1 Tax=Natronorubrum sp. A-ect3 TaxID=3242698 RepID=UPI00359CFC14